MISDQKNQQDILEKLGISALNEMQEAAQLAIHSAVDVLLLSPTGTGKTLGFLLPTIAEIDSSLEEVQLLIIAPSRELAIQIEQVARDMGTGHKIHAAYGGQSFNTDRQALKHTPSILIGTPGRIADHLRRNTFKTDFLKILVLDEFDKSLEVGFEGEMTEIINLLPALEKKIFTSATQGIAIPEFAKSSNPVTVNYLHTATSKLEIKAIISPDKDKLQTLVKALNHLENKPGIIFCNFKETISRISSHLIENHIPHGIFYGGMEQWERELSLLKFRNGTHQLLLATDLAARGIDVPELDFIIHYHLPLREEEFTHRNGRTARMHAEGTAYVLHWEKETLPDFIPTMDAVYLLEHKKRLASEWTTLKISGGRKDKISKGDIAGAIFKQAGIQIDELGLIDLKQDRAYVAVKQNIAARVIAQLDKSRLKKAKVRVSET